MNKNTIIIILIALAFAACKKDGVNPQGSRDETAFVQYEGHFLEDLWKMEPDWATRIGYHQYDSLLMIPNEQYRAREIKFAKVQLDSLGRFDPVMLTDQNRVDYKILENEMNKMIWEHQELREFEWNPLSYNLTGTFAIILNEHYEPLPKRLRAFYQKMEQVPMYYKEAEKQVKNPVPELTTLAVSQLTGGLSIFGDDLADSLKKSNIPQAEQKQILDRAKLTVDAIKGFTDWLKNVKSDKPRSFRLGKQYYDDKFKYNIQSSITPQQLYNAAVDRKGAVQHEMAQLSKKLWPKYFGTQTMPKDSLQLIAKMVDTLSSQHPDVNNFQSTIAKTIPKLSEFVMSKQLLTLDPGKPLKVRQEPGYVAGTWGAVLTPAAPYDKTANSYLDVTNLHGWSSERAESFLREYNNYTLQLLCIHEGIPGRYVQLQYANRAPSLIKSIFGNSAMIEGWAAYSELLMQDASYGGDELSLMWYKWHLAGVCGTILDYNVHNNNMNREQVIELLTHEAFQQKAEAENTWNRLTETSVQMDSYFAGYKEIIDLREAWKRKMGDKYKLKDFNEKLLSYGSSPVKFIKEAMLAEKIKG